MWYDLSVDTALLWRLLSFPLLPLSFLHTKGSLSRIFGNPFLEKSHEKIIYVNMTIYINIYICISTCIYTYIYTALLWRLLNVSQVPLFSVHSKASLSRIFGCCSLHWNGSVSFQCWKIPEYPDDNDYDDTSSHGRSFFSFLILD